MENSIGYQTEYGKCLCVDSLKGLQSCKDNSINLVITSPPFALQRKKDYGNEEQSEYVDWLCQFADVVHKKICEDGSFVIDIGGAYEKGSPSYSLYQFRALIKMCDEIGFKLAQPFYWHNPSALPAPIEWVNKRKLRAKTSVNTVWWLCKNPMLCKANVSNVLVPYSPRMERLIAHPEEFVKEEGTIRPSGHVLGKSSWSKNNGGAIPANLLQIPNSESNSQYLKYCKNLKIKGHPARFPAALPEFFIKFLTEQGDLVVDIFSGSNTTGEMAEKLHRKWQSFELSQEYVASSSFRFAESNEEASLYYERIMNGEMVEIIPYQQTLKIVNE
ncbi:MAG: site-specific DNA-methyltransferase [Bacteroidales bacterium]|nr:site-specific DNA-methyltransferase [Lachnoclostridium sp.]MCM1385486.1 site-specific DNA-methyltransferase [Lachnoclostridium sp.]MCM1466210.1 site-specific DNA-methyltransferase [Bacteroidales bacterium]